MNQFRLSGALFLGAAFAISGVSYAQTAPPKLSATPENSAIVTAQIKVRNVPSNLMAYWLDPQHNMVPTQIQSSIANSGQTPQLKYYDVSAGNFPGPALTAPAMKPLKLRPGNGYGPLNVNLPAGVETVVSIDPKNVILVRGTPTGIEQLRALVAQLDVPLDQTEIEVQFLQLARADVGAISPSFATNKIGDNPVVVADTGKNMGAVPRQTQVGFVRNNLTAKVNELIAQNKLRVITAPRVSAVSGLTAKLESEETRPMMYVALPENWAKEKEESGIWPEGYFATKIKTGIVCTPLIYKNLIQLDLEAFLENRLLNLTTTVKDGQSLAVEFPAEDANSETATLLVITARIIRRAGE